MDEEDRALSHPNAGAFADVNVHEGFVLQLLKYSQ